MECLKEIRSNKKLKDIPIAIYSTSSFQEYIEEAFACGANVYIGKPMEFNVLKQTVGKVISDLNVYRKRPADIADFLFKL